MRIIFVCINFFIFLTPNVFWAQASTMTSVKDSDPKAKAVLDKLKKQYDAYKTMEVKFELEVEMPGQTTAIQKGSLVQDGAKYQLKLPDQEIYADGKTTWLYLKKNKEVQINDMGTEDNSLFISPKQMMSIYQKGEYIYSIIEERNVGKSKYVDIEFKPISKKSDFAKIRLTIDKTANKMISLRVFSKDGSRYTLKVSNVVTNKKYESSFFTLNTKALNGVHVEDLRMD